MRSVKFSLPRRKVYRLKRIGDVHLGAQNCDKAAFKSDMNDLRKDKNSFAVLMGDQLDSIVHTDKRYSMFDRDPDMNRFDDQMDFLLSVLEPAKKSIIGILEGNHEAKISRRVGYDFTRDLCNRLDVEYLHQLSHIEWDLGYRKISEIVAHGVGGAASIGGQIRRLKNLMQNFEVAPDLVSVGHYHRLDSVKFPMMNSSMNTKVKTLGFTGTYFRAHQNGTSNYAVNKWYGPSLIGHLEYEVTKNDIQSHERITV